MLLKLNMELKCVNIVINAIKFLIGLLLYLSFNHTSVFGFKIPALFQADSNITCANFYMHSRVKRRIGFDTFVLNLRLGSVFFIHFSEICWWMCEKSKSTRTLRIFNQILFGLRKLNFQDLGMKGFPSQTEIDLWWLCCVSKDNQGIDTEPEKWNSFCTSWSPFYHEVRNCKKNHIYRRRIQLLIHKYWKIQILVNPPFACRSYTCILRTFVSES